MKRLAAAVMTGALLMGAGSSSAMADPLAGTWSGGGYVQPKNGQREKVSCRVTYKKEGAKVYGVRATCASTSAKIQQTGEVLHVSGSRYVGDFYNPQFDVSGRVRVVVSGSSQTVTFSGASGSGSMTLRRG